jgi:hypothetical protein
MRGKVNQHFLIEYIDSRDFACSVKKATELLDLRSMSSLPRQDQLEGAGQEQKELGRSRRSWAGAEGAGQEQKEQKELDNRQKELGRKRRSWTGAEGAR